MKKAERLIQEVQRLFTNRPDGGSFECRGQQLVRRRDSFLDIVGFQITESGRGVLINLGLHLEFLPDIAGAPVDIATIGYENCEIGVRLTPEKSDVPWWPVGSTDADVRQAAKEMCEAISTKGMHFFEQFSDLPGPFGDITPDQIVDGSYPEQLLPSVTAARAALLIGRIHRHVGDQGTAAAFAAAGLECAGPAVGVKRALRQLLTPSEPPRT